MFGEEQQKRPVGDLGIIAMNGCEQLANRVESYMRQWRNIGEQEEGPLIRADCPRFGTGEGKGIVRHSVRGYDLYIICDPFNYGVTYNMYGMQVPMGPDEHYQDLKRIISACCGKARRITVIMPMLYEGRQHKRTSRESLDCAVALQELIAMGVWNIITFDAHDPRVQNAIPLHGLESVQPSYQMLKALVRAVPDIKMDREKLLIISPDEGGMSRCIYYSSVLGVDLGMFYKRRNYSVIVDGRNPIEAHEYLGDDVEGRDVIIVDDIISSGDSILDIATRLHDKNASRVFIFSTFGLFCNGLESFDEAYAAGIIDKVFTTNLIYGPQELLQRPWYVRVDMSKYIAYIIDTLNRDESMNPLLNPVERIMALLERHSQKH